MATEVGWVWIGLKTEMASEVGNCCYLECSKNGKIDPADGRVDVRGFHVSSKDKRGLKAAWGEGGEATFHRQCWNALSTGSHTVTELEQKLVKEATKTAECHDSDSALSTQAARIADLIMKSKYAIGFTGAGISTAAGIGDFRGIDGKWTEREKMKSFGSKSVAKSRGFSLAALRPTYTHEAIVKLLETGHLKYLISQNTDGLHRLSGVPTDKMSELHGNSFQEKCEKCGTRYDRWAGARALSRDVPPKICEHCRINHRTGRICSQKGCDGYLMNTIINFGDNLEEDVLGNARHNAKQADMVVCLGSTLQVSPANALVEMGKMPIRLVICNRQSTPYDSMCYDKDADGRQVGSRVFGDCDRLMREVMKIILVPGDMQDWESGREARMKEFDKRRQ